MADRQAAGLMFERFADDARQAVVLAQQEAAALGHGWIGTEHLLLGLLAQGDGVPARVLRRWDLRPGAVRTRVEQIIGRGAGLDGEALAVLGIDLDEVRRRVEASFGAGALDRVGFGRGTCRRGRSGPGIPFSPRAKRVLELALKEVARERGRRIGGEHVLLGILAEGEGVAAGILAEAGVKVDAARAAIADETRLAG